MADRLQYPLLPSYVQQQSHQIPPHQQQQPQDSLSSLPAFPDNLRMWQHPQQMRSHPQDISHPQMADLFRNQPMMRLQQAQPQPSSQQFSAGLAMPQLATNQNINGPPQSSQDLSASQPQPSHMPPANFNGISNPNAHMGSAAAQQRNNSLLQNFGRPYDLGFSQNHHPQNGALAFANKQGISSMQQQSRDQQHLQPPNRNPSADMFSSPTIQNDAVRRPSPSHPPMPSQHIQNGMMASAAQQNNTHAQPAPQTSMPFSSRPLQEQAMYLRNMIQNLNNNIAAHRASPQDGDPMTKARVAVTYMTKRETAVKMLNSVLAQMQAQSGGGQGQMPWMQQQQPQQQQGPSQPSFDAVSMPRNALGIQSSQQAQHQPGNAKSLVHPTQPGQVGGQNPLTLQPNASSVQGNHVNVAGPSFPSQQIVPPNASSFNVPSASLVQAQQIQRGATQPGGMLSMIPPLEKSRFEIAFKTFCNNKQIKIDQRLLTVNNSLIDLHSLHTLVIVEGGEAKVQQKDLWSVIGGRMGFVQFPGTDNTEPSKSGPVIAQQLEHIYRQFLADFDRAYTANVLDSRLRNGQAISLLSPSQLNMMVSMADQPVPQLKAQGLSEPIIQFIETHRSHLQRLRRERESSHDAMKPTMGEQTVQSQANGMPHINQMAGLRPPPFPQPGPQNNISQPGGHNLETRQQLTHQLPPQANPIRPGKEQVQHALALVNKARQETMNNIHNRPLVNIPAEHRFEYNTLIEQLFRQATEMDSKLAMLYIYTRKEEFVRRLILLVVSVQHQRNLLSSPNPRFFFSLDNLRVMHQQMQQATETCSQLFAALSQQKLQMQQMQQQQQHQQQQQIQSATRPLNARNPFPLDTPQIRPPAVSNPLLPSPNLQPPQPQQPTPPQISLHPPPPKKKGLTPGLSNASRTATSTPSPVPTSAHTPGPASVPSSSTPLNANTPTPALPPSSSSPPAPRSPKGKTSAKAKQAPAPTPKRRASRTAAPPPVPAESPAAAASSSTPSAKRPREEDDTVVDADSIGNNASVANEPSPPKRVKTDWEIPQSEELKKKAAEVKTESVEDANVLFEQMSELLKRTADNEGQESTWCADISETIGTILKGYPETSDNSLFGEAVGRESSPPTGFKDAFDEFIDYSFVDGQLDHEEGSKAHTPDLVSSSSTNLSPESNTDGENSLSTMSSLSDVRKDDPHDLRLGLWKEVDGGESAYYQPFEWKWDSPMSILEQSWAVSTS